LVLKDTLVYAHNSVDLINQNFERLRGPLRAPKKALNEHFFLKKKWGAIDRKLFDLPRSKILFFHFFQKNLENFCVTRWGLWKKNHRIFFWKMFFKSGVQSIGNCLICLDPKSCIFIFFSKNLENFCVARWGLWKKITKYFFEKCFLKVGCNQ